MSKIGNEIYEAAKTLEKIPVCIWYEDIDQEEVEVQVEKEIGFSKEDIVSDLPSISHEEIEALYTANIENPINYNILSNYIEENYEILKNEELKTDKYINARRKKAKEKFVKKSNEIINETNLNDKVEFSSKYAPMLVAELTFDEIKQLIKHERIKTVNYIENAKRVDCSESHEFYNYINSSRISDIHNTMGLRGTNKKVGMIESCSFETHEELPTTRCFVVGDKFDGSHATNSARIIAGTYGVAPEVNLYSVAIDSLGAPTSIVEQYRDYCTCIEALVDSGVTVINSSHGFVTTDSPYDEYDMWIDYIIATHNISVVASADNINSDNNPNGYVISPARGHNVITVGACDNRNTLDISDDIMKATSCFRNLNGVEKPDIVVGSNIGGGGTSSAAPVVSGTIALMLDLRPSLAAYPEAIKAILMASCQYKALPASGDEQETMASGLTEKQGAGVFSPYLSVCIAAQGNYKVGVLKALDSYEDFLFYQPKNSANGMNVSLTWLRNNESTENYSVNVEEGKNLALGLYKNNSTSSVASSDHPNSSTEMLYYTGLSDSVIKYKVRVATPSSITYSTPTRFAYAWCLNNEIYQNVDQYEGLYYIKNASNGRYLTYNSSDNTYKLSLLSSSNNNQIFVIQKGALFNILNGYVEDGGLTYQNGNILSSNTPSGISITNAGEGKLYLYAFINGLYALNANSTTTVEWHTPSTATNKKWIVEKISYRLGDVNKDGLINANDASLILQYASQSISLYNNEKFLADVNNDGSINSQDSLEVLNIAAKM